MAFQLTEQQHAAVFDRGGGMLVSAAAGSGRVAYRLASTASPLTPSR